MTDSTRRDFLKLGGGALAATALAGIAGAQGSNAYARGGAEGHKAMMQAVVPGAVDSVGNWVLPELDYDYDALEPHIDAQTMEIHHTRHHQAYVNGAKAAEERLAEAREADDYSMVEYWSLKLSFNAGGHVLHSIFWDCMGPEGGGSPEGALASAIARDFGSVEAMREHFTAASASVEGSGWGLMGLQLANGRLAILQGKNQNLLSPWAFVPLLAVDVWEHAYYLRYQNRRGDYLAAWWNTVDWSKVARRYNALLGEKE